MTFFVREQWKDNLQAKGVIVLDRDKRRFSDIMEDKAQKLGKSWRNPSRKITLVNRDKKALKDVVVYVAKKLDHLQGKILSPLVQAKKKKNWEIKILKI